MKIQFEGRTWEFDADELTVKQATVLYLTYQLTIKQWTEGFPLLDQRCFHFAYWLMLQQNGVTKPIADCDPKIIDFMSAYADAQQAEAAEAQPDPDPTSPPSFPGAPASPTSATQPDTTQLPPAPGPSTVS